MPLRRLTVTGNGPFLTSRHLAITTPCYHDLAIHGGVLISNVLVRVMVTGTPGHPASALTSNVLSSLDNV
ncbi:hypothetical protein [Desulfosporosinus burensis]